MPLYCRDMLALYVDEERPAVTLEEPGDVWSYVQFCGELHVSRLADGDEEDGVYLLLECDCDWEIEYGLQLVLRTGQKISKLGPYDGHVTNAEPMRIARVRPAARRPANNGCALQRCNVYVNASAADNVLLLVSM